MGANGTTGGWTTASMAKTSSSRRTAARSNLIVMVPSKATTRRFAHETETSFQRTADPPDLSHEGRPHGRHRVMDDCGHQERPWPPVSGCQEDRLGTHGVTCPRLILVTSG